MKFLKGIIFCKKDKGDPICSKKTKFFLFLILFSSFLAWFLMYLVYRCNLPPENFPDKKIITIEKGMGASEIAWDFYKKDLIQSPNLMKLFVRASKIDKEIKAGEYFFDKPLPTWELLKVVSGHSYLNKQIGITIIEGSTIRDIDEILKEKSLWPNGEFLQLTGTPGIGCQERVCPEITEELLLKYPLLVSKPNNVSLEGFLFPDTYHLPLEVGPEIMLGAMLENLEKKITPELREEIDKSERSFFEILTMASLLEKEASRYENRRKISGLLWKRIDVGMPLQVDAVFPYIMGKYSLQLTLEDLKVDSPYNTYLYKGLPLGPICNPSLSSIKAAIRPVKTTAWFYLSDRDENLYFSDTYEEHLMKKAKYLAR